MSTAAQSHDLEALRKEIGELRQRIDALEIELANAHDRLNAATAQQAVQEHFE